MALAGTMERHLLRESAAGPIDHLVYLPPDYLDDSRRYPTVYLLHGRGDSPTDWLPAMKELDELVGSGVIEPLIAVIPDGPWSDRANWWIDSAYSGEPRGRPVATALVDGLVRHVDAVWRTEPDRNRRIVGGYSMGGAGALSLVLSNPAVFSAAIAMSSAVYGEQPPPDSNTRAFGAFGDGENLFSSDRYSRLGYAAAFAAFDGRAPLRLVISIGEDEEQAEAERLADAASRVRGITSSFEILPGGHDWRHWSAGLHAALAMILPAR